MSLHDCREFCDSRRATAADRVAESALLDVHPQIKDLARSLILSQRHFTTNDLKVVLAGHPTPDNVARMRDQGKVVGIKVAQIGFVFPAFQFDVVLGRVNPSAALINRLLRKRAGPEEMLAWWCGASSRSAPSPTALLASGRAADLMDRAATYVKMKR